MLPSNILYAAIHSNGEIDPHFTSAGFSKFIITHTAHGHYDFKLRSGEKYSIKPIVIVQQYDATNGTAPYSISKIRWDSENTTFSVTFVDPTEPQAGRLAAFQLIIING